MHLFFFFFGSWDSALVSKAAWLLYVILNRTYLQHHVHTCIYGVHGIHDAEYLTLYYAAIYATIQSGNPPTRADNELHKTTLEEPCPSPAH